MNRPIKFRGWDEQAKVMLRPVDLSLSVSNFSWLGGIKVPLMQFTGLLDKNGKEIYEGDIVKTVSISVGEYIGEVKFEKGYFCVENEEESQFLFIPLKLEVIGNIYENPELLK